MLFVRIHQLICEGRKIREKWANEKNQEEVKKNAGKAVDPIASFAIKNCINP